MKPLVLIAGATGYVGGELLKKLLDAGYTVRCLARRPEALRARALPGIEVVEGDVLNSASVRAAMLGVGTAYYLVHSMGSTQSFEEQDRTGAQNFANAARDAGIQRIIYLGGLGRSSDPLSTHLRSRQEVGEILRSAGVPVIEFRASVVIGSGSLSFEMIRALVERLPVMIAPRWVSVDAQPIAIADLLAYLLAAMDYQSVRRFVITLRESRAPEARAIIETPPGEECQVDYGTGPMVRDPVTGKYRRTRLFVLTLGYSRKSVRLLIFRSGARVWVEQHEKAFRRLGGTTRIVVLDNLREGVVAADIYDPQLNPLYRDVLAHYGVTALPCKVRDPDRKGKVESGVAHAQKTPLKGKRFESLEEAQAYLDHWEEHWADTRIHGRTKRQVAAMFAAEKPFLQALPLEPFRYYQYGKRTVHIDGCVEVEAAYYGAPPGWIGRQVDVQWDLMYVRLLDPRTGVLLREHLQQKRGRHRIRPEDRPRRTPPHTVRLIARAHKAGTNIGTVCDAIYHRQGEAGLRRIMGVLALVKKYGCAATENACAAALELGVAEYRFVRRYLERSPQAPLTLRQVDPLIRELVQYRDLIQQRIDFEETKHEPDRT